MKKTGEEIEKQTPAITDWPVSQVKISDVVIGERNGRKVDKNSAGIKDLAENIKATGLLNPIIIRPNGKQGKYELLAGERRLIASQIAGFDMIRAAVAEVDDVAAQLITVTENLQREDLTPLEEAAGLKILLDKGKDTKAIAADLGRSVSWVLRRSRLIDLIPEWQKEIEKDEDLQAAGVGYMEMIARYDKNLQKEILKHFKSGWFPNDIHDLNKALADFTHLLAMAPWDTGDVTLFPKMGACTTCSMRSSHTPALFEDDLTEEKIKANDRCLNPGCWNEKAVAFVARKTAELKEKNPDMLKISSVYVNYGEKSKLPKDVITKNKYFERQKGAPGAKPALMIDGPEAGTIKYVHLEGQENARKPKSSGEKPKLPSQKERERKLEVRRAAWIVNEIKERLGKTHPVQILTSQTQLVDMIILASAFGTLNRTSYIAYGEKSPWSLFDSKKKEVLAVEQAILWLWKEVHPVLSSRLQFTTQENAFKKIPEAKRAAALIGLKMSDLEKEAAIAIPIPKSWGKQPEAPKAQKAATVAPRSKTSAKAVSKGKEKAKGPYQPPPVKRKRTVKRKSELKK